MSLRSWLVLALCGVSVLAACGGDDEPATQSVTKPDLTVPQDETGPGSSTTDTTATTEVTTDTAPPPDAPLDQQNPGNGGVPAPENNRPPQDSPSNDTPPKPGSPADRFEQFCAQNPGAC